MKKTFVVNLALLLFLNLLIKPFWIFGIDRQVQNTVGTENYGVYAALFSLSIMLNILLDIGITNFNTKNIAQHSQLLRKYFSNIVILKFFLGVLYAIIALAVGALLGYDAFRFKLFAFLILNQFLLSFILYFRSNISGLHFYKTDSLISVTDRILMIVLCGYLLLYKKEGFKIEWFVYAQTISYSITCLIAFIVVYGKAQFFRIKFDYKFLLLILKQSYPFALLVLLMGLYTRMDMVMVEYMLPDGANQAGIYAQSYRVLDAVSMFAYLFATLLLPMFSRMIKAKENIAQLVHLSFMLLMIPVIVFVLGSVFYGWELMKLMYHEHYNESTHIFKVLILGFIPISSSYIFGTLLTAKNSLRQLNTIAFSGLFLNLVLNLILIPSYGAYGAAVASLTTQVLSAIAQVVVARNVFSFKVPFPTIVMLSAFVVLVSFAFKFLKGTMENWIYNLVLIGFVCIVLAFATGLIRIKEMIQILKEEK